MRIGITGVTGLIGKKLAALCQLRGHEVTGFSRNPPTSLPGCDHLRQFSLFETVDLKGLDALVHLAGESIIGFWTLEKRRKICASRRDTTRHLVASMQKTAEKVSVFVSSSATGFYGDRGAEKLEETARHGQGFLSEVAQVWEEEALFAEDMGVRTVMVRTGVVLAREGGAFPLQRRIFGLGLGGKIGKGQQYLPWIHLDDVAELYLASLENPSITGPLNAVAPEECTNLEFTQRLAATLHRPAFFNVPEFAARMVMGDLATLVLESQRVVPAKALQHGFEFAYPSLAPALADLVKH